MPTKKVAKKSTKKTSKKFDVSFGQKVMFFNVGIAAVAVIAFMGFSVFSNMGTADASGTSTLGR